jgi:hypothetical protein
MRRKLIRNVKKIAFYTFLKKGIKLSDATSCQELADFFEMVSPHRTNHDLIRIGAKEDGGYLVPNDLDGIGALFSPGVEQTASFELILAERGVKCFMADYSIPSMPFTHPNFIFEKKFIGTQNNDVFMKMSTWISKYDNSNNDLMLQMDIEGSEYEVLLDADDDLLRRFRIMVIEFHDLDELFNKFSFKLINLVFKKILTQFEVVHIHPNNSNKPFSYLNYQGFHAMEFTFLRKDRIEKKFPEYNFPHPLDAACVASQPNYPLPPCWISSSSTKI